MAGITSAVAIGASALGGALKSKASSDAAKSAAGMAQFNPWNLSGPGGNVNFNNGKINFGFDNQGQMMNDTFSNIFQQIAGGGGFNQGAADAASQMGTAALPSVFQGAMDASQQLPTDAVNAFTQNAMNNAQFGQGFGMGAMQQASQFAGQQTGLNEGMAQGLFSRAQGLMDQSFTDVRDQQLANSRALARPTEERAVNSKFQNLFNKGVLSQSGGERQIGELAQAQEMADIQRQMGADQFANQLTQQNRMFAGNLLGQGMQGRQMDQNFNLGAGGLFANMGNQMMNFGAGQAGAGLNAQMGLSDMINSRGQQRLANTQNMLGFGANQNQMNINQMLSMFGAGSQQNADMRNLIALGINAGGQGAAAGANTGQFMMDGAGSPFGSFLGGVGAGLA
jgi:hypothetical protein